MEDWARRDFRRILQLCATADLFQDVPFSLPFTFQAVDMAFPGSKFVLSVRDDEDQWYRSLVNFHREIIRLNRVPTAEDLQGFYYCYKGFLWDSARWVYGADAHTLYDKVRYQAHYRDHNRQVIEYFRHRPGDLLVLNVAEPNAMERLHVFLGKPFSGQAMPHLNKTDEVWT
jgi:hypothetical protein